MAVIGGRIASESLCGALFDALAALRGKVSSFPETASLECRSGSGVDGGWLSTEERGKEGDDSGT